MLPDRSSALFIYSIRLNPITPYEVTFFSPLRSLAYCYSISTTFPVYQWHVIFRALNTSRGVDYAAVSVCFPSARPIQVTPFSPVPYILLSQILSQFAAFRAFPVLTFCCYIYTLYCTNRHISNIT